MPVLKANRRAFSENPEKTKFQVHKNYISGIAQFLENEYGTRGKDQLSALISSQRNSKSFRKINRKNVDTDIVNQYLTLSLASELQFRLANVTGNGFLKYSNAWAPVHAYYAIYLSLQAWFICMGEDIINSHISSLNCISNHIEQRNLFPRPWAVRSTGCPQLNECKYLGLPEDVMIDEEFEVLSAPTLGNFWSRYCKILKTTREIRLDRKIDAWKDTKGRKNTFKEEKRLIENGLAPTTIFDFFWRMRIRSNYEDVRSFLMSDVSDGWQIEFWYSLEATMNCTVTLIQSLIVAYAGKDIFSSVLREFIDTQEHGIEEINAPYEFRRDCSIKCVITNLDTWNLQKTTNTWMLW